jgi:GTP:adenosylcobinamide-phosphate guanylyltransferase
MGRLLLGVFLFSVVFGLASVLLAIGDLVVRVLQVAVLRVDPPLIPFTGSGPGIVLTAAAVYFLILLPLLVGTILVVTSLRGRGRPDPGKPARWDWEGKPAVAVLTAYDDEAAIGEAVKEFKALPSVAKIIVVDNNSSDLTSDIARASGAIVVPETRQGYGFACMGGLRYALEHTDEPVIVLAEGDMTFFAEDLEKMLPYLADCEMVLGTRTTRTLTHNGSQMDWFMAWGNLFLAFLIRLRYWDNTFLGRVRLTDVGCTFRVLRREALARIVEDLKVGGNYFSPHMILVALRDGLSIVEVPIRFRRRMGLSKGAGASRRRAMSIGLEMVREIALH